MPESDIAALIDEIRQQVRSALASRQRAGIAYRSLQVSADDLLRLCDAASAQPTEPGGVS